MELLPAAPRVSIITVCFNSAATIGDAIESVLSQDYPDIEYIVIDGGWTDSTVDAVMPSALPCSSRSEMAVSTMP